jgi:50S ribosomal protein L16 3-hydroxylase
MHLQTLLADLPLARFVADYYHRLPYSRPKSADSFAELGNWNSLVAALAHDQADVLVCRRNEQYAGPQPRTSEDAERLTNEGYTLLVRHAERHEPRLAAIAADFERDLGGSVNIHMYGTPAGQFGFGWHYDAEEVFIIQTTGRKEYSLRKNTVNPWPLEEALPTDMHFEREITPLMRCELVAGDWLYIPSGYWHMGESREAAISLAIGVQSPTALDIFDYCRSKLLESLLWRQRLPVVGAASNLTPDELKNQLEVIFRQLAEDLTKRLSDSAKVQYFIDALRKETVETQP